jgi:hypothetical protein
VFPTKIVIGGRMRSLYSRRFCLSCSPFGSHNTSKVPPGALGIDVREVRRRTRNAATYRSQKRRRSQRKADLVAEHGGRCLDCGYAGCVAALDFHHRDAATKAFALADFHGALTALREEASKCDLLCACCHRVRHASLERSGPVDPVVAHRRRRKLKAVAYMGSACFACGRRGEAALFDFHHLSGAEKEFAFSDKGVPRRWESIVAELAKCVMLCANCHREVHAGVRTLDQGPLVAEDALAYVA